MPSPTNRSETTRRILPVKKSKRGATTQTSEPRRIPANVQTGKSRNIDSFPLSSLVGEDSLAPYVWLTLKGEDSLDTGATFRSWDEQTPSRDGLRSIHITNEKGKYPMVEVELYVPQYRPRSGSDGQDYGASLRKFRVGAEFSVKWGYRSAHTKWGLFRITERDIEFSQGTALLRFKGAMGYKMSSTTTADVFSTSFGKSSIKKLAALVDMELDLKSITTDEAQDLDNNDSNAITAGETISASIYKEAQKLDLDMLYDPESDALRLITPFKLDLIAKGSKPVKMTYGFPDSPIERLDVETKHPIKTGRGARGTKGVISTEVDQKSGTVTSIVVGTVRVAGQGDVFINYGYVAAGLPLASQYLDVSAFPNGPNNTINAEQGVKLTGSKVIENAERVYPPNRGYIVSLNSELNRYAPAAKKGYYHVIVQRKFKLNNQWKIIRDDLGKYLQENNDSKLQLNWASPLDISNFSNRANSGELAFIIQGEPVLIQGIYRFPLQVYGVSVKDAVGTPPPPNKGERTFNSTKVSTEVRANIEQAPEGEEFIDLPNTPRADDQYIRTDTLKYDAMGAHLGLGARTQLKNFKRAEERLKREAKDRDDLRVTRKVIGVNTVVSLQVRNPEATTSSADNNEESADTATSDSSSPKSDAVPLGVSSGRARPSRKLTLMTLKIKMKSGDWTLKTGKLIEIVDVYETINGTYYIHGEEHIIDDSGFSTEITCKKATSKQIANYGTTRRFKKGTRKPKVGESADKIKAALAKETTISGGGMEPAQQTPRKKKQSRGTVIEDSTKNKAIF